MVERQLSETEESYCTRIAEKHVWYREQRENLRPNALPSHMSGRYGFGTSGVIETVASRFVTTLPVRHQ